jgi:cell division protein FtsI (penicillin-binding protein 3)
MNASLRSEPHDDDAAAPQTVTQKRLGVAAAMFGIVFTLIAARLVQLSLFEEPQVRSAIRTPDNAAVSRADLTDRNGQTLATDLDASSLYVDARKVWNPEEAADGIIKILPHLDREKLLTKLNSKQAFVWLQRDLLPKQRDAIHQLGFPFLGFRREPRRVYPLGRLAAHAIGSVNTDNRGATGVERGLDRLIADPARLGRPVALSLDMRAQHLVQDELLKAIATFQAIGATGLVMNVHTGEIVAMASMPDFDPNAPMSFPEKTRFNNVVSGVFEMGSTFKTFTTAMALDSGKATLNTLYDARRPLTYGKFQIKDFHPQSRMMTTAEVFEHSSNIGTARMALAEGISKHKAFLSKLGLLDPLPFEIAETSRPIVPKRWGELQTVTISYGHGISVNSVQVAAATAAMVNGGIYYSPTLLKADPALPREGRRVIREETSEKMRQLLRAVVEKGTARQADVPGYPVGGKTGTADKPVAGGYATDSRFTSFVAVFPALKPQYLVLVTLDEPKPTKDTHGYATAGWNSAPTAGKIIARIAPVLNVPVTPQTLRPVRSAQATAAALAADR